MQVSAEEMLQAVSNLLKEWRAEIDNRIAELFTEMEKSNLEGKLWLAEVKQEIERSRLDLERHNQSLISLHPINGIRMFRAGDYGVMGSSVYRARCNTQGLPETGDWDVVCAGIDRIDVVKEGRTTYIELQTPNDTKRFPVANRIQYQGPYQETRSYENGDVVAVDGSTWICDAETTDQSPGGTNDWRLVAMRGEQGKPGKRGPKGESGAKGDPGEQGVGVADVRYAKGVIAIVLTNGEVYRVETKSLQDEE